MRVIVVIALGCLAALWAVTLWVIRQPIGSNPAPTSAVRSSSVGAGTQTGIGGAAAPPAPAALAGHSAPAEAARTAPVAAAATSAPGTVRGVVAIDAFANGGPAAVLVTPAPQFPIDAPEEDRQALPKPVGE